MATPTRTLTLTLPALTPTLTALPLTLTLTLIVPPPVRPASETVGRGRGQPLLEHPAVEWLEVRQAFGARELGLDAVLVGEVRVGLREA